MLCAMTKSRLLSVAHASAQWTAGIPGLCTIDVRLLDDITLRVHAGELLLVHSPDAIARTLLLTVLAGGDPSRPSRYVRATRDVASRVRIRRAAIQADFVPHIVDGWEAAARDRDMEERRVATRAVTPTLYLLRACRSNAPAIRDARQWRRWSQSAREHHDAVVIAGPLHRSASRYDDAASISGHGPGRRTVAMHEPYSRYETGRSTAVPDDARAIPAEADIREFEIRAGRLYEPRAPRRTIPSTMNGAREDHSVTAAGRVLHPW